MNLINLEGVTKSFSDKYILKNVNFSVHSKDKIGVIGVNGTGKTTLLKILAGLETVDSGIRRARNLVSIDFLSQDPDFNSQNTILEQVFEGEDPKIKYLFEYNKELSKNTPDSDRIIYLSEKIDETNGWEVEKKAKTILTKLGFNNFNVKIENLSGGEKKRVALGISLLYNKDLLILDEPTNHLDNETINWLENYLKEMDVTLVMVTHDRYFLDRVANKIIEIDNGDLITYEGNYSKYLEQKEMKELESNKVYEKKKSLYNSELKWIKAGVKARGTKQKARIKAFEELKESIPNDSKAKLEISIPKTRIGKKVLHIESLKKAYGQNILFEDFSLEVQNHSRIGIVGSNGSGKSTLIKILSGRIKDFEGVLEIGETVKIGFFSQEVQAMDSNKRVIDYIKEDREYIKTKDGSKVSASQMLERFLFSKDQQYSSLDKLSGGEKRRLYLLKVLISAPNLLFLDEPTNDLDIETLRILEDYLSEFNGAVIIVSHDRYFLDRAVNKILSFENKKIKEYEGGYSDFLNKYNENNIEIIQKENKKKKQKEPKKENKKIKFTYKEAKEFETIDLDIENLEKELEKTESDLMEHGNDLEKLQVLMEKKDDLNNQLEYKMERWEYLNNLKEEIENKNQI